MLDKREWVLILFFLTLLVSLIAVVYFSDRKIDRDIECYLQEQKIEVP